MALTSPQYRDAIRAEYFLIKSYIYPDRHRRDDVRSSGSVIYLMSVATARGRCHHHHSASLSARAGRVTWRAPYRVETPATRQASPPTKPQLLHAAFTSPWEIALRLRKGRHLQRIWEADQCGNACRSPGICRDGDGPGPRAGSA